MDAQELVDDLPSAWDITLSGGLSFALFGKDETAQKAVIAAFLQTNTIPGLPEAGVNWTKYLTEDMNPRELDAEIRGNINLFTGTTKFVPYYYIKNSSLQVSIQEAENVD